MPIKINIITIGKPMPAWVNSGFFEYYKRMPKSCQLNLIEIPALKRIKSCNISNIIKEEGSKLLAAISKNTLIIALDEHGKEWSSLEFAKKFDAWYSEQQSINFLVGGPDGLSQDCLQKAQLIWSLSKLTLPHQLVKVFIAEQIYRAWSIINKHPYHRD